MLFPNLSAIEVTGIGPLSDKIVGVFAAFLRQRHTNIQNITFSANAIGDAAASHFAKNIKNYIGLDKLDLSENSIGPNSAAKIANRITGIKEVNKITLEILEQEDSLLYRKKNLAKFIC